MLAIVGFSISNHESSCELPKFRLSPRLRQSFAIEMLGLFYLQGCESPQLGASPPPTPLSATHGMGTCLTQKDSNWQFDVLCSLGQTWCWWLCDCQPCVCRKPPVHKLKKTWGHQQSNVALILSPCAGTDMPVEPEGMRVRSAWALLAAKIMHC